MSEQDCESIDAAIENVASHFESIASKIRRAGAHFRATRKSEYLEDVLTTITWGIANAGIEVIFARLFRASERSK